MLTILAVVLGILLPLYAVYLAWLARSGGRLAFAMRTAAALGVMGFLTLVVRWDVLSTYLVYFWWAVVVVMALTSLAAMRERRWIETERPRTLVWAALDPIVGIGLFAFVLTGYMHDKAVNITSPLADGRFIVGQGGGNPLLNYHNTYRPQRYALDILALDDLGRRADGLEPNSLGAYVIYGKPVISPCNGKVTNAIDNIPETAIGMTNTEQPAGNHVVLSCQGVDITLAHLQPGSVAVSAGDGVAIGDAIGRVGNSGNTTEPHLHIHAVPAGTGSSEPGVPLTVNGDFLVRNATFDG